MKIASICRMLATRSHWVVHSGWLAVLAVVICANVVFDYFQVKSADSRLLVSENSIAANVVKFELVGVTSLINAVEELVTGTDSPGLQSSLTHASGSNTHMDHNAGPQDKNHAAELLGALTHSHPLVGSISLADSSGLIASVGSAQNSSDAVVFTRLIQIEGREPLTLTLMLSKGYWQQLAALNSSETDTALYTASGKVLLPFARIATAEVQELVTAMRGMDTDAASFGNGFIPVGSEKLRFVLRQVAAPLVDGGPLLVATVMTGSETLARWRGNMLVQVLCWFAAAIVSTIVLLVEARSRHQFEMSAVKMHESVQARDKFISVLMEHAPIMVSYWDAQRKCRYANKMYRNWFGKSETEIAGIDVRTLLGDEQYEKCASLIDATLLGESQHFEQQRLKADGSHGYVLSRYIPDADGFGVKGFFVIASDITELKLTQLQLERRIEDLYSMATTDALTGLDNRRNLLEKVQLEIDRALRYRQNVVFLMMDLDHFKMINDTYGHDAGDRVLQRVGTLLHETTRTPDHVGRLGGEEFGILLTDLTTPQATEIAEQLRRKMAALVVSYGDVEICFTVSIGVAGLFVPAENPLLDLMKRADAAMYQAKNSGRNCVRVAEDLAEPGPVEGTAPKAS